MSNVDEQPYSSVQPDVDMFFAEPNTWQNVFDNQVSLTSIVIDKYTDLGSTGMGIYGRFSGYEFHAL